MRKDEVLRRIVKVGIVPVVRARSSEEAHEVIAAIAAGGINVFEVTMTTPNALDVMRDVTRRFGDDAMVGAGSVLDAETARSCIIAGARFIVSPMFDRQTIEMCRRYSVACLPGALTPTEVVTAWTAGADMVKIFPCEAMGGAKYLRALKAPLPHIDLMPTGGVTLQTIKDFVSAGASAVGVGSELVDLKAIRAGNSQQVTAQARKFVAAIDEARAIG